MEVPRLGLESELQLPSTATAITTLDLSHVCNIHHSHGNTGSLTHWARPGIEPASSWMFYNLLGHSRNFWTFFFFFFLVGRREVTVSLKHPLVQGQDPQSPKPVPRLTLRAPGSGGRSPPTRTHQPMRSLEMPGQHGQGLTPKMRGFSCPRLTCWPWWEDWNMAPQSPSWPQPWGVGEG